MAPKSRAKHGRAGAESRPTTELVTRELGEGGGCRSSHVVASQHVPGEEDESGESEESCSSESDENEIQPPGQRPRRYASPSHRHLPRHTTGALYPPFYNRPPTPLPPSPSLTSLLRPSFPSRLTTSDSSDLDLPAARGASPNLAHSAQHAARIPRAAPKVPTYEYYGFALYLGSSAALLIYVLWAYVPAPMLHHMGIWYYPNRWWALAIPCWLVVLILYIYVALASYNTGYLTLGLRSVENLVDECAQVAVVRCGTGEIVRDAEVGDVLGERGGEGAGRCLFEEGEEVNWRALWSVGTDAVMDVPIGGVCEILYGVE